MHRPRVVTARDGSLTPATKRALGGGAPGVHLAQPGGSAVPFTSIQNRASSRPLHTIDGYYFRVVFSFVVIPYTYFFPVVWASQANVIHSNLTRYVTEFVLPKVIGLLLNHI